MHSHNYTDYHYDNDGTDTWMKVLVGKVGAPTFVAPQIPDLRICAPLCPCARKSASLLCTFCSCLPSCGAFLQVFVACWSWEDGEATGLTTAQESDIGRPPEWDLVRRMPSARLFLLSGGDVLVMPSGTFHYVYTIQVQVHAARAELWPWTRMRLIPAGSQHQSAHTPLRMLSCGHSARSSWLATSSTAAAGSGA